MHGESPSSVGILERGSMAIGVWSMTDDGQFELQEPYKTMLAECKMAATDGWRKAIYAYLEDKCPYTAQELDTELLRRVNERGLTPMQIVDEFIIESLTGDLIPAGNLEEE